MVALGLNVGALAKLRRQRGAPVPQGDGPMLEVAAFGANPGALRMLTHAPADVQAGAPLVVVLHGCSQTAHAYAEGAGWLKLADRLGFVVLCPEQTRANNANLCFNWFEPGDTARGGGEVASIRAMIAHASAEYAIDPTRVFVTGLSAGAAMATALLATYPEVFAAGALIAGLAHGAASNVQEAFGAMFQGRTRLAHDWGDRVRAASPTAGPAGVRVWPRVSIWHGDDDSTVRPVAADELVRQWTDVHGLDEKAGVDDGDAGHAHRVWRGADGRVLVELHRIRGMAHGTPLKAGGADGYGTPGPFLLEVGVSSSFEIAQFWGIAAMAESSGRPSAPRAPAEAGEETPRRRWSPPVSSAASLGLAQTRPGSASDAPTPGVPVLTDAATLISKALRSAGLLK